MRNGMKFSPHQKSKIPERYSTLQGDRSGFLERSRDYSRFTLPWILPEGGPANHSRGDAANQHGYDSYGAQMTSHLTNKLVMTLFPPQRSFFGVDLTEEVAKILAADGKAKVDLDEQSIAITKKAEKEQPKIGMRVGLIEAMKNLIISGNVCLKVPQKGEKGNMQAIPLDRYVVKRELNGEMKELITLQEKTFESFDKPMQMAIRASKKMGKTPEPSMVIKLYTQILRDYDAEDMWIVRQSADDIPVGKVSRIKTNKLPWHVLTWSLAYGEDYGRGHVEVHAGDFFALNFLAEAQAIGLVLMADIKYLIKHGSTIDIQHLNSSPTGECIAGNVDDIGILQLDKLQNFTYIKEAINDIQRRLGQAFLMQSANRRDAERVTTYELRLDASELETSLGGVYSLFAQNLQPYLALMLLDRVSPELVALVEPNILTGLDALGRVGDLDKIAQFSEMMQVPKDWPEAMQASMDWEIYSKTVANALTMETPWLKSKEELATAKNTAKDDEQTRVIAEGAAKAIPGVAKEMLAQGKGA